MAPVGNVISSMSAGAVAQATSWRVMFVIVGSFGFMLLVASLLLLPYAEEQTKPIKINFLGALMLGSGICALIVSLTFVGSKLIPGWLIITIAVVALAVIGVFFIYNQKWSKNPLFSSGLFNKSTVLTITSILFSKVLTFMERYFEPYIYQNIHGISP